MLGKRPRANMRRTTSMRGMTVDPPGRDDDTEVPPPSDPPQNPIGPNPVHMVEGRADAGDVTMMMMVDVGSAPANSVYDGDHHQRLTAVLSPRCYRRDIADDLDHGGLVTANFLRTCGLCNRRLAPGRDIYMYRGDAAFCSEECREQRMKQDERKEKHRMAVSKKVESHHNQYSELNNNNTAASDSSSNGETIAAA